MRNCAICGHEGVKEILRIKNFPVYMGATTQDSYVARDLVYGTCNACENLQIMELVPLEELYQDNHNTEVVGKTWEEHNIEFAKFIKKTKPRVVFEIGSPSATIFKKLQEELWLDKWYSIEPNPAVPESTNKKFIMKNGWVDNKFTFDKHEIEQPNAVVMSHVFEHLYNPREILRVLLTLMNTGDDLYLSVPDMAHISKNKLMPPSGLHFEHTFFLDIDNARYLLQTCGFEVMEIKQFKNHSFFIHAKTSYDSLGVSLSGLVGTNHSNNKKFVKTIKAYNEIIEKVNTKMGNFDGEIYIYGSHFPAQYLLFNGLNPKISGCLDQSPTKIGKKLYGTHLDVFSPEVLRGKNAMVICYMGPYTNEIKETILGINNKVIFA